MDVLMAKNNEGALSDSEFEELENLVHETEQIALANARLLAIQRVLSGG